MLTKLQWLIANSFSNMYMYFPREIFTQIRGAIVHRFSFTIDDLVSLSRAHIDYKCLHGLISLYWFIGTNVCYCFNSNCLSNYSLPICHKWSLIFPHSIFRLSKDSVSLKVILSSDIFQSKLCKFFKFCIISNGIFSN